MPVNKIYKMKKTTLFFALGILFTTTCMAQNVGIGTTTPLARLHVTDSSVVFSANGDIPVSPHNTPIEGGGRRMLWYPDKAAFRAGYVTGIGWSAGYIGNYSFAAGINTLGLGVATTAFGNACNAGGNYSVAMGNNSITNGIASFAMGDNNFVNGNYATAIGKNNNAGGEGSIAMGYGNNASRSSAIAMGTYSTASGNYSTAMGQSTASGFFSTALGNSAASSTMATSMGNSIATAYYTTAIGSSTASGNYSTAIGQSTASGDYSISIGNSVNTNSQKGACIIGDGGDGDPSHVFGNNAPNQMAMRFTGGYLLYTAGWGYVIGAQLTPGATSWSTISDVHKKENFVPVDDELVLQKIKNFNLSTWNYKGQDVNTMRHYGPMAQDFYAAFGKDALGKIGCDTLINEHDFISINFIAIQALEKRTQQIEILQNENSLLQNKNTVLQKRLDDFTVKLEILQKQFEAFALLQKENKTIDTTNK